MRELREEELKQRKKQRERMIEEGKGTGGHYALGAEGNGFLSVGIVKRNFECEGVRWSKAYVCNSDACNVDNG